MNLLWIWFTWIIRLDYTKYLQWLYWRLVFGLLNRGTLVTVVHIVVEQRSLKLYFIRSNCKQYSIVDHVVSFKFQSFWIHLKANHSRFSCAKAKYLIDNFRKLFLNSCITRLQYSSQKKTTTTTTNLICFILMPFVIMFHLLIRSSDKHIYLYYNTYLTVHS